MLKTIESVISIFKTCFTKNNLHILIFLLYFNLKQFFVHLFLKTSITLFNKQIEILFLLKTLYKHKII